MAEDKGSAQEYISIPVFALYICEKIPNLPLIMPWLTLT